MGPLHLGDGGVDVAHRQVGEADVAVRRLRDEVGQPAVVDLHADAGQLVIAEVVGLPSDWAMNGMGSRFIEPWKITPAAMPSWS